MADETELIPEAQWERSVLFKGLPLHTSRKKLKIRFDELMEEVTFINRRDKVTYTRCCVILMKTRADADKILKKTRYDFYDVYVHVERYQGNQHHLQIYEQGAYKMEIKGVVGKNDREVIKFLEKRFQKCSFTDIIIAKGPMEGVAEIFFRTLDGGRNAKVIAQGSNLGWEVTCLWDD
ncbi:nucleotide-binding alpha-beta plait domain-containing protein [Artemisia annua]|uniref:Nucleotide-binding alpha-beta plait domain-containing protein n=1 Tax=Artemisia annua TaxID=35608 RepID=A0A2U1KJG3_ARTAN|nr:nucleotide-binding alpha-beta plait domain-containing protein [Artemisia annua]